MNAIPPVGGTRSPAAAVALAVHDALWESGDVEGRNLALERRYAGGRSDLLAAMAEELARLQVDVIVAAGRPAGEAARKARALGSALPQALLLRADEVIQ